MKTLDKYSLIITLAVCAGLLLSPLLPIGFYLGLGQKFFIAFYIQALVQVFVVLLSLSYALELIQKSNWAKLPLYLWLLVSIFCICALALLPVTNADALIHHLAVAKWWTKAQRIFPIAWHEWSFYPMQINLAYTALLGLNLEKATALYHFTYLIILSAVVSGFIERKTQDAKIALVGFFITLTLPICIRLGSAPLVDLPLALYSTISVLCLIEWVESNYKSSKLLLSGLALGIAFSTKYNGFLAGLLSFFLFLIYASQAKTSLTKVFKGLLIVGLLALLVYAPWGYRNYLSMGNPTYPLMKSIFGGESPDPDQPGLNPLEQRLSLYEESPLQVLLIPFRIFISGQDDNPSRFDGVLSPVLLLVFIFPFLMRKEAWSNYLSVYSLFYFLFCLVLGPARVRYLAPIYGTIIIITCTGLCSALQNSKIKLRNGIYALLFGAQALWAAQYFHSSAKKLDLIPYMTGALNREAYLKKRISDYEMTEYVNQNLPLGSLVYLLYTGNRFYYYNTPVTSGGYFPETLLLRKIRRSKDAQELADNLKRAAITHLVAHAELTKQVLNSKLNNSEKRVWNEFYGQHLEKIYTSGPFWLWKIL